MNVMAQTVHLIVVSFGYMMLLLHLGMYSTVTRCAYKSYEPIKSKVFPTIVKMEPKNEPW